MYYSPSLPPKFTTNQSSVVSITFYSSKIDPTTKSVVEKKHHEFSNSGRF